MANTSSLEGAAIQSKKAEKPAEQTALSAFMGARNTCMEEVNKARECALPMIEAHHLPNLDPSGKGVFSTLKAADAKVPPASVGGDGSIMFQGNKDGPQAAKLDDRLARAASGEAPLNATRHEHDQITDVKKKTA